MAILKCSPKPDSGVAPVVCSHQSYGYIMVEPIGQIDYLSLFLSSVLLLPYLGWGIYTLRLKFSHHVEFHPRFEAATLLGVIIFYVLEFQLFWYGFAHDKLLHALSLVGLYLSGAALYGHLIISLVTHLAMDSIMPRRQSGQQEPQFGAAEACEQQSDYEGAVREYTAIAKTFPSNPTAPLRLADNLIKLGRTEDATNWFEAGLEKLTSPEESLPVVNRLFELYYRQLQSTDRAERVLEGFLKRFPKSEFSERVSRRLEKARKGGTPSMFDL